VPKGTGRPPATSRAALERVALDLFSRHGFVETTVDEIAEAAGIARRTLFRYYPSKNDLVWGDFDARLARLEAWLDSAPDDGPLLETLRDAVVRFNALAPDEVASHRQRMSLILYVPALQAHSTLRYARWRAVVAGFAARRLQQPVDELGPQLVGHVALAVAVAAYERWLADEGEDLSALLAAAFDAVVLPFTDQGGSHA
jgi:mycofactocin system transcriptional regulator